MPACVSWLTILFEPIPRAIQNLEWRSGRGSGNLADPQCFHDSRRWFLLRLFGLARDDHLYLLSCNSVFEGHNGSRFWIGDRRMASVADLTATSGALPPTEALRSSLKPLPVIFTTSVELGSSSVAAS